MAHPYAVIMAGGIGSRFWPMSTSSLPKQFLDILGTGQTLLQQTVSRLSGICPIENILVVTHQSYREVVKQQLPNLPDGNLLLEPARRNTAPCIAYAAFKIRERNPRASMIVCPADHLVTREEDFARVINQAAEVSSNCDCLFTLGITPHRPDTGYGYIQYAEETLPNQTGIHKVKTFTEKPDLEHAQMFLQSGDFLWNSGIFIWSVPSILAALEKHLPDLYQAFAQGTGKLDNQHEERFIQEVYPSCENESIDYGVMEKARNVYVLPADFGWSDLGTWGSLAEHMKEDEHGNARVARNILLHDSKDNIIRLPNDKVAVIQGLEGYIVVDAGNRLLICKKDQEQDIKAFVNDVKLQFGEKFT